MNPDRANDRAIEFGSSHDEDRVVAMILLFCPAQARRAGRVVPGVGRRPDAYKLGQIFRRSGDADAEGEGLRWVATFVGCGPGLKQFWIQLSPPTCR